MCNLHNTNLHFHKHLLLCTLLILPWSPLYTQITAQPLQKNRKPDAPSVDFRHGDLKVSTNKRFLIHADNTPFFYLGDTAWELFHRLTLADAERYLENRRRKGFTVIQAVALAELDGLNTPNMNGDRPLVDNNPTRPNEAYFRHIDKVVRLAEAKGLYIGMLPTWGDKVTKKWGVGPVVFNHENARAYGQFIGARYKNAPNIIWILGGDRMPEEGAEAIWQVMSRGITEGDGGRHLQTYHPQGETSSSKWFHADDWLNFNMLQSGHGRKEFANYEMISRDYNRLPVKPCMDGEPPYENHPVDWNQAKGWFDDMDVRRAAYWSLFAGAHGHTYGCHDIWQMKTQERAPISSARNNWYDVLNLPGAAQMGYVRRLLESRPYLSRVPDQSIILSSQGAGTDHARASRGNGYMFVYLPTVKPITVSLAKLSARRVKAWWYDPRTGNAMMIGTFPAGEARQFTPPDAKGRDWILVVDDARRNFKAPGSTAFRRYSKL